MEPGALFEPTTVKRPRAESPALAPASAPVTRQRESEPKALDFGKAAPKAEAKPVPCSIPASPAPAPLDFSAVPAVTKKPPQPNPATLAFTDAGHRAQASALAAARQLAPALSTADEALVARYIAQGLPVTLEGMSAFADALLSKSKAHVEQITKLTAQLSQLRASDELARVVALCQPKAGLIDKLKAKLTGTDDPKQVLTNLQQRLRTLGAEVVELLPASDATALRLPLALLALRSIERVSSSQSSPEVDAMHHRLDLLRAATTQAGLAHQQLKQLQATILPLQAKCTEVLTVTLTASQFASR